MLEPAQSRFLRQRPTVRDKIGVVVPDNATMEPRLAELLLGPNPGQATAGSTGTTSFHYMDYPPDGVLLKDGATAEGGGYEFVFRDAVMAIFDQPYSGPNEFAWWFSTTGMTEILAAVRVGETLDVRFKEELEEAHRVTKYHFPSGVPDSGYGEYAFDTSIEYLTNQGFRIFSSYEPGSKRTDSRLPFFSGFRVFGKAKDDEELPIWRQLLGQAVREAMFGRWQYCVLYTAVSVESFVDERLTAMLSSSAISDAYVEHILKVGERQVELHALNAQQGKFSNTRVNKIKSTLDDHIFTPRNGLVHARAKRPDITQETAVRAIKTAVEFVWDWDADARLLLIPRMSPALGSEAMIDDALLEACRDDP